jgi:hypothetical protein
MMRGGRNATIPDKICPVCGRRFAWRRKWASCWDQVKHCSDACRRCRNDAVGTRLERAIIELLEERGAGATICPSEAARTTDPDGWRSLMSSTHDAARRLANAGVIEITQRGRTVDPTTARGPTRLRLKRN